MDYEGILFVEIVVTELSKICKIAKVASEGLKDALERVLVSVLKPYPISSTGLDGGADVIVYVLDSDQYRDPVVSKAGDEIQEGLALQGSLSYHIIQYEKGLTFGIVFLYLDELFYEAISIFALDPRRRQEIVVFRKVLGAGNHETMIELSR